MLRLRHLHFREPLADALRNTAAVILPLLLWFSYAQEAATGISVGALLISLTDLPGNRRHKTANAVRNILVFFLTALLFSWSATHALLSGIVLVILPFLLSLLAASGTSAAATGTMSIALMIFILGLKPVSPLTFSLYILAGSCWYYAISLLQVYLLPFRSLHQALREALIATADVLDAKAMCYDTAVPLDKSYQLTIGLHLRIAQKQEAVRQLLLGDRRAIRQQNPQLQHLFNAAVRVIGLYELVTAMHYDYAAVRQKLDKLDILENTQKLIRALALQARASGRKWPYLSGQAMPTHDFSLYRHKLLAVIEQLPATEAAVVKGILANVEAIQQQLYAIHAQPADQTPDVPAAVRGFLTDTGTWNQRIRRHLRWHSPIFRLALRLSILLLVGYVFITCFSKDQYSYWCLLTIVIVTRPQLATTWQRNVQRIMGTIAGVGVAFFLLLVIREPAVLLLIAVFALLGFFIWNRPKYGLSALCITVSVVLCLNLYHGQAAAILSARLVYTLLGCSLGIGGMYIFPAWVNKQLDELLIRAVAGNRLFLAAVLDSREKSAIWLARKTAHERLAQLAEAIRYTRPEPHQLDMSMLEDLQVLNYRINAVITSLFLAPGQPSFNTKKDLQLALEHLTPGYVNVSPAGLPEATAGQPLIKGAALLRSLSSALSLKIKTYLLLHQRHNGS